MNLEDELNKSIVKILDKRAKLYAYAKTKEQKDNYIRSGYRIIDLLCKDINSKPINYILFFEKRLSQYKKEGLNNGF